MHATPQLPQLTRVELIQGKGWHGQSFWASFCTFLILWLAWPGWCGLSWSGSTLVESCLVLHARAYCACFDIGLASTHLSRDIYLVPSWGSAADLHECLRGEPWLLLDNRLAAAAKLHVAQYLPFSLPKTNLDQRPTFLQQPALSGSTANWADSALMQKHEDLRFRIWWTPRKYGFDVA